MEGSQRVTIQQVRLLNLILILIPSFNKSESLGVNLLAKTTIRMSSEVVLRSVEVETWLGSLISEY